MARSIFGGGTDYSHQSLDDVISDLLEEAENLKFFTKKIQDNFNKSVESGYWENKVPYDFSSYVSYAFKHYQTAIEEIEDIVSDLNTEIEDHHCNRLCNISQVADQINRKIGLIWHQEYRNKEYGDPGFQIVEYIYGDTRDVAVNLLDIGNMAGRLKQFVGKKKKREMANNPWTSGLFYLTAALVIILALVVASNWISWYALPIVLIAAIILVGIIGAFQLRNDEKLRNRHLITCPFSGF